MPAHGLPAGVAPLGVPAAAEPARPRKVGAWARAASWLSGLSGTSKGLLAAGALGMVLLGAMADARVQRIVRGARDARDARPSDASQAGPAAPLPVVAGASAGAPDPIMDSVRAYEQGARGLSRESELQLALADMARKQEVWLAAHHAYATSLDALGVATPRGMHLWLTAGQSWWSATATHDDLPGVSCTYGVGAGHIPGKVRCVATDTAAAGTP